jgi:Ca-activated chloride channel homolog
MRSRSALALLAVGILGWLCALHAAQRPPLFRTRVELVRGDVLVTDGGRPVTGLTAADFDLRDNGVPQEVQLVTNADSVTVVLALDTSGSVRGEQLDHLRNASRSLLRALKPGDAAFLETFSRRITLFAAAGREPTVPERALGTVQAGGRTALYDALYAGLSLAVADTGRSLLLLFTDGGENASFLSRQAVFDSLKRSAVIVYAVTSHREGRVTPHDRLLREITDEAAGNLFRAEADERLGAVFVRILEEFRARYLLSFAPTGVRRDDGWHRLTVKLREKRGRVKARAGYFADR